MPIFFTCCRRLYLWAQGHELTLPVPVGVRRLYKALSYMDLADGGCFE
jgi:hypothetical protein